MAQKMLARRQEKKIRKKAQSCGKSALYKRGVTHNDIFQKLHAGISLAGHWQAFVEAVGGMGSTSTAPFAKALSSSTMFLCGMVFQTTRKKKQPSAVQSQSKWTTTLTRTRTSHQKSRRPEREGDLGDHGKERKHPLT